MLERWVFDYEGRKRQNVGSMMEIYRWRGARCWDIARMEVGSLLSERKRIERFEEVRIHEKHLDN